MKTNRLRISAISAVAALAIAGAGAGAAFAAGPVVSNGTEAGETGIEVEATESETTGVEVDGVGGHADPDGVNVDHQFEGEE